MNDTKPEPAQTAPRPLAHSSYHGDLIGASFAPNPCGCEVTGDGTIPHPLAIKQCPLHAAAPALLEACLSMAAWADYVRITLDDNQTASAAECGGVGKARAAIAQAARDTSAR